ncbi:MAG TPA: O-antigen ligase family protein [Burkholderiaceae bacterium]|nr:O-antigen ligase family protein [Burkholderiaceae bacterium]
MMYSLKSLAVVLALALCAFALARPLCLQFMEPDDFARRRKVWVVLTTAAFLAPSLWWFAAVALPLLFWAGRADRHPTALYALVLVTVPPVSVPIPMPFVNQLFELSPSRILALSLLLPAARQLLLQGVDNRRSIAKADLTVLAFGALQIALYFPYESITNTMRRTLMYGLDTYLLYYVFSRGTTQVRAMHDTLASLCVAGFVLVPVIVVEASKGWLLYNEIPGTWGAYDLGVAYLFREGVLRAQGPAGHSLVMGLFFAMAFGLWLYLGNLVTRRHLLIGGILFWVGLIATSSRAPWLVGGLVFATFMLLSPAGRRNFAPVVAALPVALAALAVTPVGERIFALLPFIGTKEQANVDYRQQVAEVCWRLIKQNPLLGDVFAARYMEELRQGQGIIDLVNTYASVGVFNGLIGLTLFVGGFVYPLFRTVIATERSRKIDESACSLGAALSACLIGILLMMATSSFGAAFEQVSWLFAGLCSAYPALVANATLRPAMSVLRPLGGADSAARA